MLTYILIAVAIFILIVIISTVFDLGIFEIFVLSEIFEDLFDD